MKMMTEEKQHYVDNIHAAVTLRVTAALDRKRGRQIVDTVIAAVEADSTDIDDCLPLWLHLDDVEGTEVRFLIGFAPDDKAWLDGLVTAVPEILGYARTSKYDHAGFSKPSVKKTTRVGKKDKREEKRRSGDRLNPVLLPPDLRFFACDEAYKECEQLGNFLSRWPLHGFSADDMEKWMNKQVAQLSETYPYIAEADRVIGGKLSEALMALGRHPYQPPAERNRLMLVVREAAVCSWTQMCDELLDVIQKRSQIKAAAESAKRAPTHSLNSVAVATKETARPSAISEEVWDRVPVGRRHEAVVAAAKGLRRGVHPEDSVIAILEVNPVAA